VKYSILRALGAPGSIFPSETDELIRGQLFGIELAVVEGEVVGRAQFETDRARFLGRGRGIRAPISVIDGQPLSDTSGAVLDPIFSLRRRIRLAPGATAHVTFWTLIAASRGEVLDLADKHHDPAAFERASTLAWTQAQVQLFHLGARRRVRPANRAGIGRGT
jgi:cyclic beta-1,2-glucan synthetase